MENEQKRHRHAVKFEKPHFSVEPSADNLWNILTHGEFFDLEEKRFHLPEWITDETPRKVIEGRHGLVYYLVWDTEGRFTGP